MMVSTLNQGKTWWSLLAYHHYRQSDKDTEAKVIFAAQLAGIWGADRLLQLGTGTIMQTPIARVVWAPVLAGGILSYAIAGDEGLQNYEDFLTEPTKMPERVGYSVTKVSPGVKTAERNKIKQGFHARLIANLKAIQINNLRYAYTGSHAATDGPLFDINNPDQQQTYRPGTISIADQAYEDAGPVVYEV